MHHAMSFRDNHNTEPFIPGRQSGLSLIEVMAALFILALASSFIIMTIPPRDQAAGFARKIEAAAETAAIRANLTGQPSGLRIEPRQITVLTWHDGDWQPVSRGEIRLPGAMTVSVDETRATGPETWPADWPQIVFDPLGHSTVAGLRVQKGSQVQHLTVAPAARIIPERTP